MGPVDITVVLTVYNQPLSSIETSMRSVAVQQNCSYQLLIADDHSDRSLESEVSSIARNLGIEEFAYIRRNENVQTVRNILLALPYANGRYVKALGSGDELYDDTTLASIVKFCDANNVTAGFGDIVLNTADGATFRAPRTPTSYSLDAQEDGMGALYLQLATADWIPAGAQFFTTELFASLLTALSEEFHVRYCEDFAQTVCLPAIKPAYLDRPILIYEWGVGVSNGGSRKSRERLYTDHENLYRTFTENYPSDKVIAKAQRYFKLRQFAALKTPFYSLLQKLFLRSYTQG